MAAADELAAHPEDDRLAGVITERDVLRASALGTDPDRSSVDEIMTAEVFVVPPDMQLQEAAREMGARCIRHLPVALGARSMAASTNRPRTDDVDPLNGR